eukprot:CAMPEP_0204644678 /NCGR_PEP_ID=MMETSP0718-20130828/1659_1 /ASSEMBLY_ACC=CAM_ASM_000674 /TAXON_ID=230516 /ORGANISM="Chaetoceros curvisetus" /LENGTH=225 /DNA_ID=CAMNT_0051666327 /DNA_START=74 /DNA_END=748 /DNA_ORIENTATION=-
MEERYVSIETQECNDHDCNDSNDDDNNKNDPHHDHDHTTKQFFSSQDSNSNSNSDRTDDPVKEYLSSVGYKDPLLQDGMRDALRPVFGKDMSVEQLKSFGTAGLEALSNSVQEQLISHDPDAFVGNATINIPHHNYSFDIQMTEGTNFMTYATEGKGSEVLNEYLECACDGNMSCSTCHIVLDEETYSKLDPPCEAELDMLDLAYEPTHTSRLGCQIVMTREIDG